VSERLVVVGDALLDRDVHGSVERLSPDAPVPVLDEGESTLRPGGAGLAAVLCAREGHEVALVSALAPDRAGSELRGALEAEGVRVIDLGLEGATPEKIRFRSGERSLMRLDRGGRGGGVGAAGAEAKKAIGAASAVLVSDYGRGVATAAGLDEALAALDPRTPLVWDPHPRGPAPPRGVTVATPNEAEVARLAPEPPGAGVAQASERALALRGRWEARALCMTRGAAGALLVREGRAPLVAPAPPVAGGDPCGAGDRFASWLAAALARGESLESAVGGAVSAASLFVAAGGAAASAPRAPADDAHAPVDVVARVRSAGGTVVATGGCFDLLHAGHVRTLEAARSLGDCLVVCLNSDASVSRLKGPERPLVPQEDRASVLAALGCVDSVVVFDEDTPERVLEQVRPAIWVKGGDYGEAVLPEERVLRSWGGRAVILPYVEGRSTTRLIQEAAARV
jgi:rfaE bifunctional protein nucleotidyltransferase chain/domain/rfaE bifunctional protein kinase chain/domain